jgi:hypothetical protein
MEATWARDWMRRESHHDTRKRDGHSPLALWQGVGGIRLQVSPEDADACAILDEPPSNRPNPSLATQALADRALRAAVFGYLASPLAICAGWLLICLLTSGERVPGPARWRAIHAGILLLPLVGVFAIWRALQ